MLRKNTAGQFIHFQGVDASTGGIKSGVSVTARRCIDGTFAAATGTVTEDGSTGWYKFALSQADTNGNNLGFNFTGTGMVPVTINVITTAADPTDGVRLGLTALPNATAGANTGLPVVGTQVPNATAGASGGLLISGSNSGTTTLAALTVTGATTLTGNVALADGLTIAAPSTGNRAGVDITGNGTGSALKLTAGATGNGVTIAGGSSSGDGIDISTTSGHGIDISALGSSTAGIRASGVFSGMSLSASGVGVGFRIAGGATSGDGMTITATSGSAFSMFGAGSLAALRITGAAASGATAGGAAVRLTGGAASTTGGGTAGVGLQVVGGAGAASTNGAAAGATITGGGTTTVSGGNGLTVTGTGDEDGIEAVGAGTGVDIRADITGDVTGNLSGSVGSLTTNNDKTGYALSATGSAALTEDYAADGAAPTLNQILYQIWQFACEKNISGTTLTVKKLDGSTDAMTFTLDSSTAPAAITRAT